LKVTRSLRLSSLRRRFAFSSAVSGACFSSALRGLGSFSLLLFRLAIVSANEKAGLAGAVGAAFFSIDFLIWMSALSVESTVLKLTLRRPPRRELQSW